MTEKRFIVSLSPHLRHGRTIRQMILTTMIALIPAVAWGVYQFGFRVLVVIIAAALGAIITEATVNRVGDNPYTIKDFHAALVGLVLALLLPPAVPLWIPFLGGVLAILVGKAPFGPLGSAPLAPALVGVLILALSWPAEIDHYTQPRTAAEAVKADDAAPAEPPLTAVYVDPSDAADYCTSGLFLGNQVGAIGTISPLLLLLGGLLLLWRKVIRWQAPVGFLIGVAVTAGIAHGIAPGSVAPATFHLFTGATMFGAFFLCSEWTSTPVTPWGMFLFGLFAGGVVILFRVCGMPFGRVPWAIVLMSLATPLFDRIASTPFGKAASHA